MSSILVHKIHTCTQSTPPRGNDSGVTVRVEPFTARHRVPGASSMQAPSRPLPSILPVAPPIPLHQEVRLSQSQLQMAHCSGSTQSLNTEALRLSCISMSSMLVPGVTSYMHSAPRTERKSGFTRTVPQECSPTTLQLR